MKLPSIGSIIILKRIIDPIYDTGWSFGLNQIGYVTGKKYLYNEKYNFSLFYPFMRKTYSEMPSYVFDDSLFEWEIIVPS